MPFYYHYFARLDRDRLCLGFPFQAPFRIDILNTHGITPNRKALPDFLKSTIWPLPFATSQLDNSLPNYSPLVQLSVSVVPGVPPCVQRCLFLEETRTYLWQLKCPPHWGKLSGRQGSSRYLCLCQPCETRNFVLRTWFRTWYHLVVVWAQRQLSVNRCRAPLCCK